MAVDADSNGEGGSCAVTQPPNPRFVPPTPHSTEFTGQFWYGSPALWTMLGPDGTWEALPYQDGLYSQKLLWWRQGYVGQPQYPPLTVTGSRLDGSAPPLVASAASNGFKADLGSFMVVGIGIPAAGCWQITGHESGTDLSFVIWVAAS